MTGKYANARDLRDPKILPKELRRIASRESSAEMVDILEHAADDLVALRTALKNVRGYIANCDHQPALDEIDAALGIIASCDDAEFGTKP